MPSSTLKSWVAGRTYPVARGEKVWEPLIQRPDPADPRLSFSNLVEAHVVLALRKQYNVRMRQVRAALDFASSQLGIERVLLDPGLRAMPGHVFLERLRELTNLGARGQGAMPEILEAYLERIEWDPDGVPRRMFPVTRTDHLDSSPKILSIDPSVAFGRPTVRRRAITTAVIAERFRAGEGITGIADDYELEVSEVEEALRYELPQAA